MNDGGSAFPAHMKSNSEDGKLVCDCYCGMSLRDWFAGMAIQGEIMFQGAAHLSRVMQLVDGSEPLPADDDNPIEALARVAYLRADAMLAAREKGQSDG